MMDKDFEMQGENRGPIVVQRPNIPNDYSRERLADLLDDDEWTDDAESVYNICIAGGASKKVAFLTAICSTANGGKDNEPKPRAFTAAELQAAIQFFTDKQIPIEHIEMWGKGIDPYEGNPADLDEF